VRSDIGFFPINEGNNSTHTRYHYNWSTDISSMRIIGIQKFRLPTHGPTIHSTEDGNHSDRNSRAPVGRCKVVHLHLPGTYF